MRMNNTATEPNSQAKTSQQQSAQWLTTHQNLAAAMGGVGLSQAAMLPPEQIQALLRAQQSAVLQQRAAVLAASQQRAAQPTGSTPDQQAAARLPQSSASVTATAPATVKPTPFWSGKVTLRMPQGQTADASE
jgi:hypothetical protein